MSSTTKLGRFFKLSGMTASVAGQYLGTRVAGVFRSQESYRRSLAATHDRAGNRIARTLGQLKGPVMKLGQLASLSSGLLPRELAGPLEVLRRDAPPTPYGVIAGQLEAELGAAPVQLFARFDREPYAAASIGQVHRAALADGREVVVKVQYPGIEDSVDGDLSHLRLALRATGMVGARRHAFDRFFEQIRSHVSEELDYQAEAKNARLLANFHGPRHPFVRIPEVIADRSSRRVLTLSYEGGDTLEAASRYPQEVRDLIGDHLVRLMYSEIFELGILHGDPNPADFAFADDGTFALYDFGCLKRFTTEELCGIRDILIGVMDEDHDAIERGLVTVGARDPDGPPVDPELYRTFRELLAPALRVDEPFDLGASRIHLQAHRLLSHLRTHLRSFRLPAGLLLLQRVNLGYYGNLRKLRARVYLRPIIERAALGWPFVSQPDGTI